LRCGDCCRPHSLHPQISPTLTHHAATGLFFLFGLRTLYSALFAWEGGSGEMEEVEAELKAKSKKAPKGKGKGKAAEGAPAVLRRPRGHAPLLRRTGVATRPHLTLPQHLISSPPFWWRCL